MKAWRVKWKGHVAIIFALTRGRAIWRNMRQAEEVGYAPAWAEMEARRAPEYDRLIEAMDDQQRGACWSEEVLQQKMEATR